MPRSLSDVLPRVSGGKCKRLSEKWGLVIVLLALCARVANAQCQQQRPALQMLRYDQDWSLLQNPKCVQEPLDRLKYIALGHDDWYLSLGGEIRCKYENYDNPGFGTDPVTPNGYILQRYLLHGDWHFGQHFRLFMQFPSGLEGGRNGGPRLTDEDVADLHQAFLDIANESHTFVLRIGRQEAEFGSGRLIGESEGLNIRRAFHGFRVIRKLGQWNWNTMLFHPVLARPNTYAIPDHTQTLWGTGFVRPRENGGWAIYYIGLDRKLAVVSNCAGALQPRSYILPTSGPSRPRSHRPATYSGLLPHLAVQQSSHLDW